MLRALWFAAAAQRNQSRPQEMSILRQLFYQGRVLLRNCHIFGGGSRAPHVPQFRPLKIEPTIRSGSGHAVLNSGVGHGVTPPAAGNTSPFFALQWIGSQVRRVFITNVLKRVTTNDEARKQAVQRFLYGDSKPFFALVGISLASGAGAATLQEDNEFDGICWEIRNAISKMKQVDIPVEETNIEPQGSVTSVSSLRFGSPLAQGCNAAVYSANWADSPDTNNYPLAVKMMFNYDFESNAFAILKSMVKEIVPAQNIDFDSFEEIDRTIFSNVKRCPPHPNVINISHAFADQVPMLPESIDRYPSALPRRLNPEHGLGRNMSLFLVMKRYDCNLHDYLRNGTDLKHKTRLVILTQLLEGVAHLRRHGIAHRDLKADNVVVNLSLGEEYPQVTITDFGCCLADKVNGLTLPFRSEDMDRGGNAALMAPEVITAVPGMWKWISYEKSDVWSIGAIAYEIFGSSNPFYRTENGQKRLDSRYYEDEQLPPMLIGTSVLVQELVKHLLKRNPDERLSANEAATICQLLMWGPTSWLTVGKHPSGQEIMQWLLTLTTKILCHASDDLEYKLIRDFLRRTRFSDVKKAVRWIQRRLKLMDIQE